MYKNPTKIMRNHLNWLMIKKKLEGKLSVSEEQQFQHWLQQNAEHQLMMDDLQHRWQKQDEQVNDAYKTLKDRISKNQSYDGKGNRQLIWYRIAASLILIGLVGIIYHFTRETNTVPQVAYIEKSTVAGQTATVSLADGSVVRLNSHSKLIYPENFSSQKREVYLQGEGYFEVQPDPERRFVVHTGDINITVLGTSFNIRAVPSENPEITVRSGKVHVQHSQQESLAAYLGPDQQAIFDNLKGKIITRQVDVEGTLAWMKRRLEFQKITFSHAMQQLARVYNLEVEVNNKAANDCLIRAIYQNESLENVLKGLQLIVKFEYEIVDDAKLIIDVDECIN